VSRRAWTRHRVRWAFVGLALTVLAIGMMTGAAYVG